MPVAKAKALTAAIPRPAKARRPPTGRLRTSARFTPTRISSSSGLQVQVTSSGAPFAIRHGGTLINRLLPGPAEEGIFRLLLRWRAGDKPCWAPLVGSGIAHGRIGKSAIEWVTAPMKGWTCRATLALHPKKAAWAWNISLHNRSRTAVKIDAVLGQDLGLGNEPDVRNSEAFLSQYVDLLPIEDPALGWVVLARQNLAMEGGRHPWLATACASRAASYCTDGTQFFGADHRLTRVPAAAVGRALCSRRLQYECAMAGLQSIPARVGAGASAEIAFVSRFLADHPEASAAADLESLREVIPVDWIPRRRGAAVARAKVARSLFTSAPWLHGQRPSRGDWTRWFPGERRHEDRDADGRILSFFTGAGVHVVSRDKEASLARPHGHILRSGGWRWIDPGHFGTTCYAEGIFSAQAYLGNPTFARLLPVIRDSLGIGRSAGQRVFVRRGGVWHQLGIPSAFSMTTGDARWIYRLGADEIHARVWCSRVRAAVFLELKVGAGGKPMEFLVTHQLALDANEFDSAGTVAFHGDEAWATCRPAPESLLGRNNPASCFAIAAADPGQGTRVEGDASLCGDDVSRLEPCVTVRPRRVGRMGIILCGSLDGPRVLSGLVEAARLEWSRASAAAAPAPAPVRVSLPGSGAAGPAVARMDEILPWMVHNAAIHFSAPHGLEQHGGAAWGVRDVCQGSIEWLLSLCAWPIARHTLELVFSQQYAHDGSWPQWFMHPPYQSIQHAESHGDVCFWPVKALCDYVEASNDLRFLGWGAGYTDPRKFTASGPEETLLLHCDRVVDLCERRFLPGTALVNYGDGDWDDTLQPAHPEMRTRMVSSWTVGLAYHTFRQLASVCRRIGELERFARLERLLSRMRTDFAQRLMPGGIVAGFLVTEADGTSRPLLHPLDNATGIRYRLLPMTRAVLSEMFTPVEAARHMAIVHEALLYPDGVRLMSEPARYHGGCETLFKRAETAANVGREIGLQYVHAHLRYAEAMAKVGDAERLWKALQVVNPVSLEKVVPNAMPRQSNVYFSSSDANFDDRYEAQEYWEELKTGKVGVRGGWRLYSSGPGIYVHAVRASLLGLRESFGEMVFDPVLPKALDGLVARATICGRPVRLLYQVRKGTFAPIAVRVNGTPLAGGRREANPYRPGGLAFAQEAIRKLLLADDNTVVVEL